jgi:hypothetical protein
MKNADKPTETLLSHLSIVFVFKAFFKLFHFTLTAKHSIEFFIFKLTGI